LLAVTKPQLGWSEVAEQTLAAAPDDHTRLSVGAKAMNLALRGDARGAMDLLEPHAQERWALEAMVRVTKIWGAAPRRAEAAERLLARGPDQPMQLECGQALAADAQFERAREILVRLSGDHSAPKSVRTIAFHLSMLVAGRELGDWNQAAELLSGWIEMAPRDPGISAWQVALAANTRRGAGAP
jgi:hypothetical protein